MKRDEDPEVLYHKAYQYILEPRKSIKQLIKCLPWKPSKKYLIEAPKTLQLTNM